MGRCNFCSYEEGWDEASPNLCNKFMRPLTAGFQKVHKVTTDLSLAEILFVRLDVKW